MSYELTSRLGADIVERLAPLYKRWADDGQYRHIIGMDEQRLYGDIEVVRNSKRYTIEVKAEVRDTGNIFAELFSNFCPDSRYPNTQGWAQASKADRIYYLFLDTERLCSFERAKFQKFLFEPLIGFCKEFILVSQRKHEQLNLTTGFLVPVKRLLDYEWFKASKLEDVLDQYGP